MLRRATRTRLLAIALHAAAPSTLALDVAPLWDVRDPAASEARFRAALVDATGDDATVLLTQIARTHGLRRDFDEARRVLAAAAPRLAAAGPEARARWQLELGRTHASATHAPGETTDADRATARRAFETAWATARDARLDGLAVDAIHMLAFVDTAPVERLRWAEVALDFLGGSRDPAAARWEASIRHNAGVALLDLGRPADALAAFERALALRRAGGDPESVHVARWTVARTFRDLGRLDDALALQRGLEAERAALGRPDPHVFAELAALLAATGDAAGAARYSKLQRAAVEAERP